MIRCWLVKFCFKRDGEKDKSMDSDVLRDVGVVKAAQKSEKDFVPAAVVIMGRPVPVWYGTEIW